MTQVISNKTNNYNPDIFTNDVSIVRSRLVDSIRIMILDPDIEADKVIMDKHGLNDNVLGLAQVHFIGIGLMSYIQIIDSGESFEDGNAKLKIAFPQNDNSIKFSFDNEFFNELRKHIFFAYRVSVTKYDEKYDKDED